VTPPEGDRSAAVAVLGVRPRRMLPRPAVLRSAWLRTLVAGAVIYALLTAAALDTRNVNLVPAVLLLGALLLPVTFVMYLFERLHVAPDLVPSLGISLAAGGSIGVAAASVLEYQTLRDLGTLPMLAVGLIEESVKLAVPLWLFVRRRVHRPADGLLIGVAAGTGFAVLETMGYGLVALIGSGGRIGAVEEVLLLRGLLSPIGHAAWTGLVCAALWRTRASSRRSWLVLAAAFAAAVSLHALWDSADGYTLRVAIGTLSGLLLLATVNRVQLRCS
jgi:RsiW-degrading membrane proteinase PrsW (M82 family)